MSFAITGTVLAVGGAAYGARQSRNAAREVQRGTDAATAESARQYDQTRADLASGRGLYEGANALLGQLYGIPIQSSEEFRHKERSEQPMLIGDTELPAGTTTRSVGRGWYEVWHGGQRIGTLRPGGPNGRFINDTGADINALFQQQTAGPASRNHLWRPTAGGGVEPVLGINPTGVPSGGTTGNMAGFFASPDYNFRREEGTRGIQQTFAARGGAQSGNALRALAEFNSNLASGEFGNYFNRLSTLVGLGSAATSQTAAYGADAASQAGRNALIAGDARASGIADRTNAITGGIQNLAGLAGYFGRRPVGGVASGGVQEIPMYSLPRRI